MTPLVFNSTPLIYLSKVGLSKIFRNLKEEKLTSLSAKREVVDEGKRRGASDAIVLEKLFESGILKIVEPKDRAFLSLLTETKGLHLADAEVLALARERKGLAVIDDEVARKTAKVYGIAYVGSVYILMKAVSERLVTRREAKQAVNDMISSGWRCSVETYAMIMDALGKV